MKLSHKVDRWPSGVQRRVGQAGPPSTLVAGPSVKLQLDKELLVKLPKTSSSSSCKKRGASSDQEQPGGEKDVALDVELGLMLSF